MIFEQQVQLSITVLLICLVVVFIMLAFLNNRIKKYGEVVENILPKNGEQGTGLAVSAPVKATNTGSPRAANLAESGIPEEVVAVISAAVYMMYGTSGASIASIRRAAQPSIRSAWAMAGLLENTRPF